MWSALNDRGGYSSPVAATIAGVPQIVFLTAERLVGLSPRDGTLYWEYSWQTSYDCNIATPVLLGDFIFISSGYGKGCAALKVHTDGNGHWQAECVYEHNQMSNHFSSCVAHKDHLYGFHDPGLLTCMDFRTGMVKWTQRGFDKGSLMIADGNLIILGENGKLAVAETSSEGYRQKAAYPLFRGQKCWTVPVLAHGRLYVRGEEEVVCLDLRQSK